MSFFSRIIERISYQDEEQKRTKTAFVLSGGGNKGVAHIGALRALLDKGIKPDFLIGASVGALNATGFSAEPTHEGLDHLTHIWLDIVPDLIFQGGKITRALNIMKRGGFLFENTGLAQIIEKALAKSKAKLFSDLTIPVRVVSCNYDTGQEVVFVNGPIKDALLASAALPGIFPLVNHCGMRLVDGGVVDSVPIWHTLEDTVKKVYIIDTSGSNKKRDPHSPLDVILQSFNISRNQRFQTEIENSFSNYGVKVIMLPKATDFRELEDFSNGERIIDEAYVKTQDFLNK